MTAADVKMHEAVAKAAAAWVLADREDDAAIAAADRANRKRARKYTELRKAVKAANPRAEGEYEGAYESRITRAVADAMHAAEVIEGGVK
jgi:hypothetical protein